MTTVGINYGNMRKAFYCHSGLSGIFLENNLFNIFLKKDSDQTATTEVDQGYI